MSGDKSSSAYGHVYVDIGECLSLRGAGLKQARNITEGDLSVVSDAALAVLGGKIDWIGPRQQMPSKYQSWKTTSLGVRTVVPGWIDAHTHALFAGSRADEFELRVHGATYEEIAQRGGGILSTVKSTRAASTHELEKNLQRVLETFTQQGVTTVEIKSGYGLEIETELKMLRTISNFARVGGRPRVVSTFLGAHAKAPEFSTVDDYFQQVLVQQLPEVIRENLARRVDIFVERGYFSLEQLKVLGAQTQKFGLDLVVHSDQLSRTGSTGLAAALGARSVDHCVHINDEDIQLLARSQTTAVLLPTADFYIRIPYPPARRLLDSGARVALATDFNPGSAPSQDISFVGLLARHEMRMSLAEVIVAFTLGGAYALGLQGELGTLETGKVADFVGYDRPWKELFYQPGGPRPIHVVMGGIMRTFQDLKFP